MYSGGELSNIEKYAIDRLISQFPAKPGVEPHHIDGVLTKGELKLFLDMVESCGCDGLDEATASLYAKAREYRAIVDGSEPLSLSYWKAVHRMGGEAVAVKKGVPLEHIVEADYVTGNSDGETSFAELVAYRAMRGIGCTSALAIDPASGIAVYIEVCDFDEGALDIRQLDGALRLLDPKFLEGVRLATDVILRAMQEKLSPRGAPSCPPEPSEPSLPSPGTAPGKKEVQWL